MRWFLPLMVLLIVLCTSSILAQSPYDPMVRIGDITRLEGVRSNQLIGYGLVTGLDGSGDSTRSTSMIQSISNMLSTFGVEVAPQDIRVRNVAAVIVTAELPPFTRAGDRIDVIISSLGDARSLQGGILLLTPIRAPNGEIFAVAQGPVSIGGYNVRGGGTDFTRNHPTSGRIPQGGIVEKEVQVDFSNLQELSYILEEPNFATSSAIAQVINENYPGEEALLALATDAGRVRVTIPDPFQNQVVDFIAQLNSLEVRSSVTARVVINERTGTIVMGHNVRLSTVAVAHGNLTVMIEPREIYLAPEDEDEEDAGLIIQETTVDVIEEEASLALVGGPTISDLIQALNAVGTTPRDLIAIIQAIKAQGALHADLIIM